MNSTARTIMHADMDAFYASVEQHDDTSLKGLPVIVGGTGKRGVVAAASYEARRFGVRSAMPVKEARQRCPDGIYVRPRMTRYQEVSRRIFNHFRDYTPLVQGLSLDEAFLDVTDSLTLFKEAKTLARQLKKTIYDDTGLTVSIGIGPNKLIAKIASDADKPDGLYEVTPAGVQQFLDPLPITAIFGVGPKTASRLRRIGVNTLGQLRHTTAAKLRPIFGRYSEKFQLLASGIDDRQVTPDSEDKSISNEETYENDISDRNVLARELLQMTESVCIRLRNRGLFAQTVTVKLREPDFTTHTRSHSFSPASNHTKQIYAVALQLLENWLRQHPEAQLRLMGVGTSNFTSQHQLGLFSAGDDGVDTVLDAVQSKFGREALVRGRLLDPDS
ncbi:MAG: DNA polymerase IV [Gammaproteobacteria bacterium]|nr:DNA polymerase IV [Gammaproteobacteria bacterium]